MSTRMLSLQTIFNRSYRGLKKQGFRAALEGIDACMYITPNGLRCAIGHVLTKSEAKKIQSNGGGPVTRIRLPPRLENLKTVLLDTVVGSELQAVHDNSTSPLNMRHGLHAFAKKYSLKVPR